MFKRKNCGTKDRVARVVIGALIGASYLMGYKQGTVALVLGVVSLFMAVTGAAGYCALYEPMGIDTRENKD
jgi:general stress protein CsbA